MNGTTPDPTEPARDPAAVSRLRLTQAVSLVGRWDYSRFVGEFQPVSADACAGHEQCGQGALANRQYDKHAFGLQLEIEWL